MQLHKTGKAEKWVLETGLWSGIKKRGKAYREDTDQRGGAVPWEREKGAKEVRKGSPVEKVRKIFQKKMKKGLDKGVQT